MHSRLILWPSSLVILVFIFAACSGDGLKISTESNQGSAGGSSGSGAGASFTAGSANGSTSTSVNSQAGARHRLEVNNSQTMVFCLESEDGLAALTLRATSGAELLSISSQQCASTELEAGEYSLALD